jgi:beta-lactamase class D
VHGLERSGSRYTPASTFKIPHSLFALDADLIKDEFQVIQWDRVKRSTEAWNENQTLRSAMRNSVVWVYQRFANGLGPKCEAAWSLSQALWLALLICEAESGMRCR